MDNSLTLAELSNFGLFATFLNSESDMSDPESEVLTISRDLTESLILKTLLQRFNNSEITSNVRF